jgi:glycosyltransferase involved in cell wall biosynthesis
MISVCLASYNGGQFIKEQIISILEQLSSDDELLISDDGSHDNTISIVQSICDSRIRIVGVSGKLGIVKNFERVLLEAKGEYIFLSDQDDVWLPSKVQKCSEALKKYILVVTDCVVVNQDLNKLHPSFFELRHSGAGIIKNIWKNSYLGCCMAFRKELLNICLPIPKRMPMHDMWLGLVAEADGNVLFIDEKLSLYRRHQSAASPTASTSAYSIYEQVNFRLILIWYLLWRVLKIKVFKFNGI